MKKINHQFFDFIGKIGKINAWQAFAGLPFPKPEFLRLLKQSHPFVFDRKTTQSKMDDSTDLKSFSELVEEFSLPFKTSLYLLTDPHTVSVTKNKTKIIPVGYLIHELTPETFKIFCVSLYQVNDDGIWFPVPDVYDIDLKEGKISRPGEKFGNDNEIALLAHLTNSISVKRIGVEQGCAMSIKTKETTLGYTTVKYDNVYHIADKTEYDYTRPLSHSGEINWEWSGFWRGHWRAFYIEGAKDERGWNVVDYRRVGKNRQGVYEVPGYTWVVEHIKGDKKLAEIKTRMVIAKK